MSKLSKYSFHLCFTFFSSISISPVLLLITLTCCISLLYLFLCFAILNNSFSPFFVSSFSYSSSYALFLAFATSLLGCFLAVLQANLLASSLTVFHTFSAFLLSFSFSWTSWFHHHVSGRPAALTFPDVSPSFIPAMLRIISATLCQCSGQLSIPLLITCILNLFFTFESFSFHYLIFFIGFGAFLHFVQMIVALTTIRCGFATLSMTIILYPPPP